ncbi:MAG: hypothetical protein M0Z87_09595 [Actinomycetota bacterium]|nr:hypothetical protein [Actinomycetota bacterium]
MSTDTRRTAEPRNPSGRRGANSSTKLRTVTVLLLVGIAVEFVFGTYVNLAVTLPRGGTNHGGATPAMKEAMTNPAVLSHILVGIAVAFGGVVLMGMAAQSGNKSAAALAAVGVGALGAAAAAGMVFLAGGQSAVASFVMAMGFLVSFTSYFALLAALPRR